MSAAAISAVTITNTSTPWVSIYAVAAVATLTLQNVGGGPMKIRVDASAATSDAVTAAAFNLNPGERVVLTVASGDKVMASMVDPTYTGILTKLVQ